MKAHAQGKYVSYIKAVRSEFASQTTQLEQNEAGAMASFMADTTPENYSSLAHVRRELKLHYTSLVQSDAQRLVTKLFETEDKNGKLLANLVAEPTHQTIIPRIQSSTGGQVTDPEAGMSFIFGSKMSST